MNCAKVLFSCCIELGSYTKFVYLGKRLDKLLSLSLRSVNLMLHSTVTDMEDNYDPPKHIRGMKVLDRNAITKTVKVSCLTVDSAALDDVIKILKKNILKVKNMKSIQELEGNKRRILINSKDINTWNDLDEKTLEKFKELNITENNFSKILLELKYENWFHKELIKAILPENESTLTSFSVIGHIIHLNLKNHLLEYKNVIAEILMDKVANIKTVVYKKNRIENVYRNFEMEVLCGEPNLVASVKENHYVYELDFAKVYWNPRLGNEHFEIVNALKEGDVLIDVFAGIGPFAIPAAKKKCFVLANDLNPESVKWLNRNIILNKVKKENIKVFNKEGGDFILSIAKENLVKLYEDKNFSGKIYFVMNLPALAPQFIKYMKGLISERDLVKLDLEQIKKCLPIVHCYFFTAEAENLQSKFEEDSGLCLKDIEHNFYFIRKVSNSKSMHRITFTVPVNYLITESELNENGEPLPKRICT